MGKELQELVQGDAGTDGEGKEDPVLVTTNLDEEEPTPDTAASMSAPFTVKTVVLHHMVGSFPQFHRKRRPV